MTDKVKQSPEQTQLDLALKMAQVAFWEFDLVQNVYILNDQAFAILRTSAEKEGGYAIPADEFARRFIHPDDIPVMTESFRDVLHAADPDFASEREYRSLFGDGQTGYLNVLFKAEWDGNGRVTRLYGTGQDITQRRQAEEELKLNKIQFKTLFDTASDDIELLDPQANIVDCNETHANMLGYGRDELIGRNVTEFFTEDTIQRFEEKLPTLQENGYVKCEMGLRRKDGSIIRVWRQAQAVQDDNGNLKGILIHNRDIMDPYMIEEQIELQNIALKASASAIVITDAYGIVQWANPAFTQLTGYEPEEVIGQNPNVLKSGVHDDAFYANMWQTLTNGEVWRSEIVNRKKDGTFYTEEMTITPVLAHGDEITNYIAIKQDITERKAVETAITKQAVEMKTVAEVSTAAATIRDTDQLLQTVVDLAKARFELYHAHIYLFNDREDELVLTVGAGDIGREMVAQEHSIPVNQEKSLVAKAARTQKGVIENDVLRNPAFLPNPLLPETRSEMAVPMMIGDRVIGVLDVQAKRVGRFTPQDVTVKTALAAQIAVALENARSYEHARTSLAETEALLEITKETSRVLELEDIVTGVLDRVLVTTGFDAGLITIVNPDTNNLEIVSHHLPEPFLHMLEEKGLDGTLCDLVYRRQENVIVVNMADSAPIDVTGLLSMGYQSYQGVPLESKGTVLGTLCLFSQRPITSERANRVFLQAVGQQVGIAIQNTSLFNQSQAALFEAQQSRQSVQEFLDRQRALQEINIELFNIDDLDELYRSVIELAHTRLGFERVGMYLLNESKDMLLGTYGIDVTGNIRNEQGPEYVIDQAETIDTFVLNRNRLVVDEDIDLWYQGEAVGRGWHIGTAMWTEDFPIGVIFADNLLTGQPLKPYQAELLFAYAGIVSNLIQRNRFEEAIRERETLLRTIIDSTPDWIFVKDRNHRYQMVNKGYADALQMTPDDFIGKNDLDIGFPEEIVKGDPEKGIRGFWADDIEIMESGEMKVIDIEPAVVDGEQRYLSTIKAPLKGVDGEVTAVIGFVHDITDRIQVEEKLAKQANELAEITRRLTREGWQDYVNQTAAKDMGYIFDGSGIDPVKSISETPDKTSLWLEDNNGSQLAQPFIHPIAIHGETIGQLAIMPEEGEDEVDPEVAEVISSVIEQLGARIENLRLTDQTQMALAQTEEQAQRLGKLNEMSTALNHAASLNDIYQVSVDETTKIMNVDETSISLLTDTKAYFEVVATSGEDSGLPLGVPIPVAETPMQGVLQENQIIRGDMDDVFALSLHIPLVIGNDVIGTLNVGYKESQAFKASDESLLRQVAALVSSNIENMRFLVNERSRAQREQMLRQITQRIRSSADVETIMRTAVQEIGRTLGRKTYIYLGDDGEA